MSNLRDGFVGLLAIIATALIATTACAETTDDVVVLQKKSGQTSEINLTRKNYSEKIEKIMSSVNGSVLPTLDSRDEQGAWKLRAVLVGLGVNFEAGLGPIIGVAAKSRFQLIYSRKGDSFVP